MSDAQRTLYVAQVERFTARAERVMDSGNQPAARAQVWATLALATATIALATTTKE